MDKKITQLEILKEYFMKYPNKNIKHPEVVDWVTNEWEKRTGEKFRDPDRGIRKLAQEGFYKKYPKVYIVIILIMLIKEKI